MTGAAVGIFDRIGGGLRKAVGAALAPAADPRDVYANPYQKQRRLLDSVVEAVAQVGESKARLAAKAAAVRTQLDTLQDQAREELRAGRQELARLALQRRQAAAAELAILERQLADVEREQADLKMVETRLSAQLDALAARQEVILARYSAAEAQVRIKESAAGLSEDLADLTAALRRAEDRTESMEARAAAIERLVREGMLEAPGEDAGLPTAELPAADVESELARLEAELSAG